MKFIYPALKKTIEIQLLSNINTACHHLANKLYALELKELNISEYNQRYLGGQIKTLTPVLQTYAYLLALSLQGNKKPLESTCIIDYGAGPGLIALLAKELGAGRVIYNDIYAVSCNDAQILSNALNLPIMNYICGDLEDVITFTTNHDIAADVIISFDVIEHIYDIESYFKSLRRLSKRSLRLVFGSGANTHNPILNRRYSKAHLLLETQDRQSEWGHKERDTLKAYITIRKEIILNHEPSLTKQEAHQLSINTRGLIKEDIKTAVEEYVKTGSMSYKLNHPTNTCDPLTGNWAEHLMDTQWIKTLLNNEGFTTQITTGYWGSTKSPLKQLIGNTLNLFIQRIKYKSLIISPYYIVCADTKND